MVEVVAAGGSDDVEYGDRPRAPGAGEPPGAGPGVATGQAQRPPSGPAPRGGGRGRGGAGGSGGWHSAGQRGGEEGGWSAVLCICAIGGRGRIYASPEKVGWMGNPPVAKRWQA